MMFRDTVCLPGSQQFFKKCKKLVIRQLSANTPPLHFSGKVIKNTPANAGDIRDAGSIPASRRSPGGGHGNPLQYSCLENPMDKGTWWVTVHGVLSQTQLKWISMQAHTPPLLKSWIWIKTELLECPEQFIMTFWLFVHLAHFYLEPLCVGF